MRAGFRLSAFVWGLAAAVLVFSQLMANRLAGFVRVVASSDSPVLQQELWHAPLSKLQAIASYCEWPIWFAAVVAATLFLFVIGAAQRTSPLAAALCLVVLSICTKPEQLPIAFVLFFFCRAVAVTDYASRPWKTGAQLAVIAGLGFAASIDFGIVVLGWMSFLAGEVALRKRSAGDRRWVLPVHFLLLSLLLAFIAVLNEPLLSSLLRPLGNAWFTIDPQLFPFQAVPFGSGEWGPILQLAGLSLLAVLTLAQLWTTDSCRSGRFVLAMFFSFVGAVSPDHRWLALVGLSTICCLAGSLTESTGGRAASHGTSTFKSRASVVSTAVVVLVSIAHVAWTCLDHGTDFLLVGQQRLVDTQGVNISGPVVLANLEHSADWQHESDRGRFRLAAAGRWDGRSDVLPDYAQFVRDLTEGRREHYIRTDGSMGGYAAFMAKLQPSLVVLESSRRRAIRVLSVDLDWRVMAIDAQRTVFAKSNSPETQASVRRAGELFYFLEWPNPQKRVELNGALQTGTSHDARIVAGVLNAIRLPYAALRVLPVDTHRDTIAERAGCYVELAHRVHRQTGHCSLLDQVRAIAGLRDALGQRWISLRKRKRLTRQLKILGELSVSGSRNMHELEIRKALCRGGWREAKDRLSVLEPNNAAFLSIFLEAEDNSSEVPIRLDRFYRENPYLKSVEEALFYLGCLELEKNQPVEAIEAFRRSQLSAGGNSRFSGLRSLYMRQLGAF